MVASKENNRADAQTTSHVQYVAEIFYAVLQKSTPLDRELKNFFRRHPQCGSNDRKTISESCFSLFRWYGWLRTRLPGGLSTKPQESKKFCQGLAAALWLDGYNELPFFICLLEISGIDAQFINSSPSDIRQNIKGLGHFFKIRKLSLDHLVPEWFGDVIPKNMNLLQMIESLQKRVPVWIRVQNHSLDLVKNQLREKNISFFEHPHCSNALRIEAGKFKASAVLAYQSGGFEIQDLASQCVGLVCQAREMESWWDVCAGAGGKSLLLADQMQGKGEVVATDIRDAALKQLEKRAKRGQFKNIHVKSLGDACGSQDLFDGVLVDAPCSCTGVWRRNPDLRWTTKKEALLVYTQQQMDICQMAALKVKEDGVLVYATCSLCVDENERIVETFLEKNKDFQLESFVNPLNQEAANGMLRINFEDFNNDGMFVAKLKRNKRV